MWLNAFNVGEACYIRYEIVERTLRSITVYSKFQDETIQSYQVRKENQWYIHMFIIYIQNVKIKYKVIISYIIIVRSR